MARRVSIILLLLLLLLLGWYAGQWYAFLVTPLVKGNTPVIYEVKPGTGINRIADQLYQQKLLRHPNYFKLLARLKNATKKLRVGEYEIKPGMTPGEFISQLASGKIKLHKVTIIEGWNFDQMMKAVDKNPYLRHSLKGLTAKEIMTKIGHPDKHPEGRFFPSTYLFARGAKDTTILKKAYNHMQKLLTKAWRNRAKDLLYKDPYQALIVASMVEKETAVPKERPMIAGVILRRLRKQMRLQIDATVIYGIKHRYNGNITRADLRHRTPYNTYVITGLPPTPIAMPGESAILAALHPAKTDALYFVAKGDGSHVFSATLKEHDEAVIKYQLNGKRPKPKTKSKPKPKTKQKTLKSSQRHSKLKKKLSMAKKHSKR